jgi:hypothetical protein
MPFDPFRGPAKLSEFQRQALGAGLSAIFPPLGMAYQGGRLVNAAVQWFQNRLGTQPGQLPIDSETNNPPMYGPDTAAPGGAPSSAPSRAVSGPPLMNNTGYNQWRAPGSATYQQLAFPGSAIGPRTGSPAGTGTEIRPGAFLMGGNARPGFAAANYANILARNQL